MRWRKDFRVKRYFAIVPYEIRGEVRWLETVYVKQRYNPYTLIFPWDDIEFVDRCEYERYLNEKENKDG